MRTTTNLKSTVGYIVAGGRTIFNVYNETQEAADRTMIGSKIKADVTQHGVWEGGLKAGDRWASDISKYVTSSHQPVSEKVDKPTVEL